MIVPGRDDELCLAAGLFKLAEMVGPGFCPRVWMIDDAQVCYFRWLLPLSRPCPGLSSWSCFHLQLELNAIKRVYGADAVVRVCFFHVSRNLLTTVTDYCEIMGVRAEMEASSKKKNKKKIHRVGAFRL